MPTSWIKRLFFRICWSTSRKSNTNISWCRECHFCMTFDLEGECYICYAFWVPYEVYIKDFSKFHCFPPVLSSWWSSIHLLELKIQMWRIPPCHTSKVASWHVHSGYDLHLWSYLSKIWLKVSKTCNISCFLQYCQFLTLFETLSQILPQKMFITFTKNLSRHHRSDFEYLVDINNYNTW